MVGAFLDFYHGLLGSRSSTSKVKQAIIDKGSVLSLEQQQALNLNFSGEEIKEALFSIHNDKSPRIDGYSSFFFKKSWSIIGSYVIAAIHEFFRSGFFLKEINVTTITMIPKVLSLAVVGDYRPITCCSVLYKTITKLLNHHNQRHTREQHKAHGS